MMLLKNWGLRLSEATLPAVAGLEGLTQDPSLLPGVFTENTPHPEPVLLLLACTPVSNAILLPHLLPTTL